MKQKNNMDELLKQSFLSFENEHLNLNRPTIVDVRGFKPAAADEYELLNISKPLKKYINNEENIIQQIKTNWPLKKEYINQDTVHINLFTAEECQSIINLAKSKDLVSPLNYSSIGSTSLEHIQVAKIRVSPTSWFNSEKQESAWIFEKIAKCVEEKNNEIFNYDLKEIQSLQFTVYDSEEKGFYGKHTDPLPISYDGNNRKLSLSIQLSDPNDYEGGDLLLHVSETPIKSPKAQGTTIIFPSHVLHEVTPVTKGIRYSLVAWITGPRFK
jgi:PKHD-type hydroxylase